MKLSCYSFTSNRVRICRLIFFSWMQTLPEIDSCFHPCRFDDVCYSSNVLNSPEFKSARRSFWLVRLLLGGVEQPLAEWEAWGYTVYYSAFHTTPARTRERASEGPIHTHRYTDTRTRSERVYSAALKSYLPFSCVFLWRGPLYWD
jgi:hypothetical protein